MSNPARQKGTAFTKLVSDYLTMEGVPNSREDFFSPYGDITLPGWVIETKACKSITLAAFMDQLYRELIAYQEKIGALENGALVVKRRGRSVGQSYVVMDLDTFLTWPQRVAAQGIRDELS